MATTRRSVGFTAKPLNPMYGVGKKMLVVNHVETITSAAAAVNDISILAGPLTVSSRVARIIGANPAFTSATDNDLGFYKKNEDGTFTALDADVLWDGITLASAVAYRDLLTNFNSSLTSTSNIGDLLGLTSETEPTGGIYLGLLRKVASTAASVTIDWDIHIEEATTD